MPLRAKTKQRSGADGFTLVELIVVITLIIVLSAMIVPAVLDAMASGRETVCINNLRQLGYGFTQYLTAKQGNMFPLGDSFEDFWLKELEPYSNDLSEVAYCPNARHPKPGATRGGVNHPWSGRPLAGSGSSLLHNGKEYHEGSYAFNGWLYAADNSTRAATRSLGLAPNRFLGDVLQLDSYVTTPVFADGVLYNGWPEVERDSGMGISVFDIDRHRGGINVVFVDGHATKVPLSDLFYLTWHRNFPIGPRER